MQVAKYLLGEYNDAFGSSLIWGLLKVGGGQTGSVFCRDVGLTVMSVCVGLACVAVWVIEGCASSDPPRVLLPTVLRLFCSFHGHAPLLPFSTSSSLFQIVGRGMWNAVRHRNPVLTRMRSASHLLGNSFQWNMLSQRKERMTQRFVVRSR